MFWNIIKWGGTVVIVMVLITVSVIGQTEGGVESPPIVNQPPVQGNKNFNF